MLPSRSLQQDLEQACFYVQDGTNVQIQYYGKMLRTYILNGIKEILGTPSFNHGFAWEYNGKYIFFEDIQGKDSVEDGREKGRATFYIGWTFDLHKMGMTYACDIMEGSLELVHSIYWWNNPYFPSSVRCYPPVV